MFDYQIKEEIIPQFTILLQVIFGGVLKWGCHHQKLDHFRTETNDYTTALSSPHHRKCLRLVAWDENSRRSDATFWSQELWWGQHLGPRESDFVVFFFIYYDSLFGGSPNDLDPDPPCLGKLGLPSKAGACCKQDRFGGSSMDQR